MPIMRKNTKVRKKHKYKHVILDKKKYYFYIIKWHDILGDSGHHDKKSLQNMEPAKMVTQGYIFHKDNQKVISFASYDEDQTTFSDVNTFPRGCVKSMKKVEL